MSAAIARNPEHINLHIYICFVAICTLFPRLFAFFAKNKDQNTHTVTFRFYHLALCGSSEDILSSMCRCNKCIFISIFCVDT